jgi:hypothetical protein
MKLSNKRILKWIVGFAIIAVIISAVVWGASLLIPGLAGGFGFSVVATDGMTGGNINTTTVSWQLYGLPASSHALWTTNGEPQTSLVQITTGTGLDDNLTAAVTAAKIGTTSYDLYWVRAWATGPTTLLSTGEKLSSATNIYKPVWCTLNPDGANVITLFAKPSTAGLVKINSNTGAYHNFTANGAIAFNTNITFLVNFNTTEMGKTGYISSYANRSANGGPIAYVALLLTLSTAASRWSFALAATDAAVIVAPPAAATNSTTIAIALTTPVSTGSPITVHLSWTSSADGINTITAAKVAEWDSVSGQYGAAIATAT